MQTQRQRARWRVCGAAFLALSAQSASAQFVNSDSAAFGTGNLITDTISGLTWLDLDVTRGISFNTMAAHLALNPAYAGFRFATSAEIRGLFQDAGFYINTGPIDDHDPSKLAANAGFAAAFDGVPGIAGYEFFRGYMPVSYLFIPPDTYFMFVGGASYAPGATTVGFAFDDEVSHYSSIAEPDVGSWLVSTTTVAPVPEPSTYALMFAGLAAVGVAVRRRQTRPRSSDATSPI